MKPDALQAAAAKARSGDAAPIVELLWPGTVLDAHQLEFLNECLSGHVTEAYCKGCVASGKTSIAGMLACLWLALNLFCRAVLTSQRYEHAKAVLFNEFVIWWRRSRALMQLAEPGKESLWISEERFLLIASPESGEGFSGMHSPNTLFIFDEASSVPDAYRDLASTQARLIVALSNPRRAAGWFKRGFPPDDPNRTRVVPCPFGLRLCQTIRGSDCLNVKEGRTIIPGQLTRAKYEGLKKHPDPRWVSIFADGQFPDEDEELQIVLPSWLSRHQSAWKNSINVDAFGLDVAGSDDGDETILAAGSHQGVARIHARRGADTMQTVGWVIATAREIHGINLTTGIFPVVVDSDGLGLGIADRLAELGVQVIRFRGGATADDPRSYANARAEAYGTLGRRLDPRGAWGNEPWALPDDPNLSAELCAPEKIYGSDGIRFSITPKNRTNANYTGETLIQKLGRSPDRGDAVAYLATAVRRLYWLEKIHIHRDLVLDLEKTLGRPTLWESPEVPAQICAEPPAQICASPKPIAPNRPMTLREMIDDPAEARRRELMEIVFDESF